VSSTTNRGETGKSRARPGLLLIGLVILATAGLAVWWGFSQGGSSLGRLSGDLHSLYIAEDGRIIYGQHSGIQVSSDGGKKWTAPSGTGDAMAISASPVQPETIYQAGHDLLLKSIDGGTSWREPGLGIFPEPTSTGSPLRRTVKGCTPTSPVEASTHPGTRGRTGSS
jgi:hypothetical protein